MTSLYQKTKNKHRRFRSFKEIQNRKRPGMGNTYAELLKYGSQNLKGGLLSLFNKMRYLRNRKLTFVKKESKISAKITDV